MGRKLTNWVRIVVAVVALALGAAAGTGHSAAQQHGHQVMAEDKGPTVIRSTVVNS
ncbi:hypothetical protein ABT010_37635 [Streptomyces sp. NPDC002668]|uniref:hypothetical protein n=1 Tax=Streptomyces sp. NPDC002668 TaxID=3154422 RepID=UPI00331F2C04